MTFLILFTALILTAAPQRTPERPWKLKQEIPSWIRNEFRLGYYDRTYEREQKLYPEFLRGDFNGDGKQDYALQVRHRRGGKFGVAVFQSKRTQSKPAGVFITGAGKPLGSNIVDLDWVEIWSVYSKDQAYREMKSARLPRLWGDVIKLQKRKGRAGFMYWTGSGYAWFPVPAAPK